MFGFGGFNRRPGCSPKHGFGRPGKGEFFSVIARAGVQLTDAQVEELAAKKADTMELMARGRLDMMSGIRALIKEMSKPQLDKEAIRKLHKDMQAKRNQMGDQFFENILSVAEALDAGQRKQIHKHMQRAFLGLMGPEHGPDWRPGQGPPGPPGHGP
jgi:hypothetical protein